MASKLPVPKLPIPDVSLGFQASHIITIDSGCVRCVCLPWNLANGYQKWCFGNIWRHFVVHLKVFCGTSEGVLVPCPRQRCRGRLRWVSHSYSCDDALENVSPYLNVPILIYFAAKNFGGESQIMEEKIQKDLSRNSSWIWQEKKTMISERSQILASPRCCERYIIPYPWELAVFRGKSLKNNVFSCLSTCCNLHGEETHIKSNLPKHQNFVSAFLGPMQIGGRP